MNDSARKKCKEIFTPEVQRVFVSSGKLSLASNQQHWWLAALQAVIFGLFENEKFNYGTTIEINFDGRASEVLGTDIDYRTYHNNLCNELKNALKEYEAGGVKINISSQNDKRSIFVNFADIICGLVRTGQLEAAKCDCNKEQSQTIIFQEILRDTLQDKFGSIKLLGSIFKNLRKSKNDYENLWAEAVNFLKINFEKRGMNSKIMPQLNELKGEFYIEYKNFAQNKLSKNLKLDILNSMLLFDTHNGAIKTEIKLEDFISILNTESRGVHCRITDNWESYVRFNVLLVQIDFNGYDFCKSTENLEKLWEIQDKIQSIDFPFDKSKDDTTAEITGSLGQAYSFAGNLQEAKEYYEIAERHVNKSYFKTASYQFCIYFREENIEKCYEYFEKQTGICAADFCKKIDECPDAWFLLSYARLRGLEIHKNGNSNLPKLGDKLSAYNGYPRPLILKWLAFEENSAEYLQRAAQFLLRESGFTIRTLALPVIQMLFCFEPKNDLCKNYGKILEGLKNECENFRKYINNNQPNLNTLENNLDLWHRAMLLPGYYA